MSNQRAVVIGRTGNVGGAVAKAPLARSIEAAVVVANRLGGSEIPVRCIATRPGRFS